MHLTTDRTKVLLALSIAVCWLLAGMPVFAQSAERNAYASFITTLPAVDPHSRVESLENFILKHPPVDDAYLLLNQYYMQWKSPRSNGGFYRELIENSINPQHQAYARWAMVRLGVFEDKKTEIEWLEAAIRLQPQSVWIWSDYATRLKRQLSFADVSTHLTNSFDRQISKEYYNLMCGLLAYYQNIPLQMDSFFRKVEPILRNDPRLLNLWAYRLDNSGKRKEATAKWREAEALALENNDLFDLASIRLLLGIQLYQDRCLFREAEAALLGAHDTSSRIFDLNRKNRCQGFLGDMYKTAGRTTEAMPFLNGAIAQADHAGNGGKLAEWYRLLAMCHYYQDEYGKALELLLKARNSNPDNKQRRKILRDQFEVYLSLREEGLCDANLKKIFSGTPRPADSVKVAKWQATFGDTAQARQILLRQLKAAKSDAACHSDYFLNAHVGKTYYHSAGYHRALEHYKRALSGARDAQASFFEGLYHVQIAALLGESGDENEAAKALTLADSIAKEISNDELRRRIALGNGILALRKQQHIMAESYFSDAALLLENTRSRLLSDDLRVGYFSSGVSAYHYLALNAALRYYKTPSSELVSRAIRNLERGRARVFKERKQQESLVFQSSKELDKCENNLQALQRRFRTPQTIDKEQRQSMQQQLDAARVDYRELFLTETQNIGFRIDAVADKEDYLTNLQHRLKRISGTLVLYQLQQEHSFAVVITPDDQKIIELATPADTIVSRSRRLLKPLSNQENVDYRKLFYYTHIAHQLYLDLLEPIKPAAGNPKHLLVVPDPAIANLPLEILQREKTTRAQYSAFAEDDEYFSTMMVHKRLFTYLPSSSILLNIPAALPPAPKIALFGQPAYEEGTSLSIVNNLQTLWNLSDSPQSATEIENIAPFFKECDTFVGKNFIERNATEALMSSHIVHFSAHGIHTPQLPEFSGIAMSLDSTAADDGLLLGYELRHLKIKARLITLSACETGIGNMIDGEGVMGLPRLFLAAGAETVVMTRWNVDGRFASRLMPVFYEQLQRNNYSWSQALLQAQLKLMETDKSNKDAYSPNYRHPFFWAAYGVYGHPGN